MIVTYQQIGVFFLVLSRLAGLIPMVPVFNSRDTFAMSRVVFIVWVALLFMFVIPMPVHFPNQLLTYVVALISEFLIGVFLGYSVQLLAMAVDFAGMLIDVQSALAAAAVFDPSIGRVVTMLQKLLIHISLQVFLVINAHHAVLSGLFQSFRLIPVSAPYSTTNALQQIIAAGSDVFEIALHLASPTLLMIFIVDFSLGMVNRIAPQVNVFQFSFQIKPWLSMWLFGMLTAQFADTIYKSFEAITERTLQILMLMMI